MSKPTRDEVIREGVERARQRSGDIDDLTARAIASYLSRLPGDTMSLLERTGEIADRIYLESTWSYAEQTDDERKHWVDLLTTYCLGRLDEGPVMDWPAPTWRK
jgi:hypothetical protein